MKTQKSIYKSLQNHKHYVSKQPMELINEYTGEMKCKVCGSIHWASAKPRSNGRFYRGAWQCHNGCKVKMKIEKIDYLEMKKKMELTPERVFEEIKNYYPMVDGRGNVMITLIDATDAQLIEEALDNLFIPYDKVDTYNEVYQNIFGFLFRLDCLKDKCPLFYNKLKKRDEDEIVYINKNRQ